MLPRTSAGKAFHTLMASADVVLHPFPFGGSKTAADGLSLGDGDRQHLAMTSRMTVLSCQG